MLPLAAAAPARPLSLLFPAVHRPRGPVVVSAAELPARRGAASQNGDGAPEKEPGIGAARLADFRSDRFSARRDPSPVPSPAEEAASARASGALRGSDVLHALQRAVAKREERKMSDRKKKRRNKGAAMADGSEDGGESFKDGEQVRPIEMKSDWARRIDELEMRIQVLRSQYH